MKYQIQAISIFFIALVSLEVFFLLHGNYFSQVDLSQIGETFLPVTAEEAKTPDLSLPLSPHSPLSPSLKSEKKSEKKSEQQGTAEGRNEGEGLWKYYEKIGKELCANERHRDDSFVNRVEPRSLLSLKEQLNLVDFWGVFRDAGVSFDINCNDPATDTIISRGILSTGVYTPQGFMLNLLLRGEKPVACRNIIDLGANIGSIGMIYFMFNFSVTFVEMDGVNAYRLSSSLVKNGFDRKAVLFFNAVSNTNSVVYFQSTHNEINRSNKAIKKTGEVELTNSSVYGRDYSKSLFLDQLDLSYLKNKDGHQEVAFLKIDVETFERQVLSGAVKFFYETIIHYVVLEYWSFMNAEEEVFKCEWKKAFAFLRELGFVLVEPKNLSLDGYIEGGTDLFFRQSDPSLPPIVKLKKSLLTRQ